MIHGALLVLALAVPWNISAPCAGLDQGGRGRADDDPPKVVPWPRREGRISQMAPLVTKHGSESHGTSSKQKRVNGY